MSNPIGHILRNSRIVIGAVLTALLTGVLVSYGRMIPSIGAWLSKIQFLPAAMAFALATIAIWLIATLVFGRIYCSTVCPVGVFQDLMARLGRSGNEFAGKEYHYSPPRTAWRNISLFIVVLSVLLGISIVTSMLDPYSIYARACVYIVKPLWGLICNIFSPDSVRLAAASVTGIFIGLLPMAVIGWIAMRHGRLICNTICPVGTTLGYISRYSILHIDINTDKCIQCRKCEHVCKSECIDLSTHVVDSSRCVNCFDCLTVCPNDAIKYTSNRHQLSIPLMQKIRNPLAGSAVGFKNPDTGTINGPAHTERKRMVDRRTFLATGAIVALTPALTRAEGLIGLCASSENTSGKPERLPSEPSLPVTPPGISSRSEFLDRCTSCGLCISHCPTRVLRPSTHQYGLLRMLHPVKDYDASWCSYTCTRCTNLCPTGALRPLTREEKIHSPIGIAKVQRDRCISYSQDIECGLCADNCPAEAIIMAESSGTSHGPLPVVDPGGCIGCGKCQFVCPATPLRAIVVSGLP